MSYDVYVDHPQCHALHWHNHTSNTSPMWVAAGIDIAEWKGKPVSDVLPALREAVARIASQPAEFKRYEAPNGWGDVDSTLRFLRGVLEDCEAHTDGTLLVSR